MILFDTHCHLDDERFDPDREETIARMQEAGVRICTTVGSDIASSRRCMALAEKYPFIYFAAGVHPHEAKDAGDKYLDEIDGMLRHPKCAALGEIGLDYYYDLSPRDVQKRVLEEQMELAYDRQKAVIYHVRDAHGDMLSILKAHKARQPKGVIHCCSASAETVREYLKLGLYISFAGPVTFKTRRPADGGDRQPLSGSRAHARQEKRAGSCQIRNAKAIRAARHRRRRNGRPDNTQRPCILRH